MAKCECGKRIVYKRTEKRPVEEEPRGMYAPRPHNLYRGTFSNGTPANVPTKEEKMYACEDDDCIYSYEITEKEYLEKKAEHEGEMKSDF